MTPKPANGRALSNAKSTNDWSRLKLFRPARLDDADHIVDLLVPLFQKVGAVYGIRPEAESIIKTVIHTIERGVCLVGESGCAGGYVHPYPWNHNAQVGIILFWNYSRPSGIHVFEAIVERFRSLGATHINCASHFPDNRIGRHYMRFGLHPAETQFISSLATMKTSTAQTPKEAAHVISG